MKETTTRNSRMEAANRRRFRGGVYCAAVSRDRIRGREEELPYEMHSDIAVIFYMLENRDNVRIVIPVTNEMVKESGLSAEELGRIAWENTVNKKRATMHLLSDMIGEPDHPAGLYVLSNEEMYFGAVAIFYPGLLSVIADEFGSDLFILPSSVHECLILPCSQGIDPHALASIVRTVNETEVAEEDILSFSVYRYSRKDDRLSIDNF